MINATAQDLKRESNLKPAERREREYEKKRDSGGSSSSSIIFDVYDFYW